MPKSLLQFFLTRRNKRGFTLIELLVVIAIISILAAILFPVFASAREKARQTACVSNLKQIGLAFMQYTQDYDEYYPCDPSDPDLWQGRHFRWPIMPYLAIGQQKANNPADPFAATSPYAQILTCPSDTSTAFNGTSYAYSAAFYLSPTQLPQVTSFVDLYGAPYGTLPISPQAQSMGRLQTPASKILAGEWTDNHDGIKPLQSWYPPSGWADTRRNYLFADGHVRAEMLSKIAKGYDGVPDPNTTINGISGSDVQ